MCAYVITTHIYDSDSVEEEWRTNYASLEPSLFCSAECLQCSFVDTYPAGKLPRKWLTNYQALKWERHCPSYLLLWLMHCYGMHNLTINIIVVVIRHYIIFSYHFRNLEDASGKYGDTDIEWLTLTLTLQKRWSNPGSQWNTHNRQVDEVSWTVYVHTTHKHQPHASLSYLI